MDFFPGAFFVQIFPNFEPVDAFIVYYISEFDNNPKVALKRMQKKGDKKSSKLIHIQCASQAW